MLKLYICCDGEEKIIVYPLGIEWNEAVCAAKKESFKGAICYIFPSFTNSYARFVNGIGNIINSHGESISLV